MARLGKGTKNFLLLTLTTNQVRRKGILNMTLAVHYLIYQLKDKALGPKHFVRNYKYIIDKAYVSAGIMKGNGVLLLCIINFAHERVPSK